MYGRNLQLISTTFISTALHKNCLVIKIDEDSRCGPEFFTRSIQQQKIQNDVKNRNKD